MTARSGTSKYWIGIDIGGANIKIADVDGNAKSIMFPMWIEHLRLADVLREVIDDFSRARCPNVAVTMTGELADCFASKKEGVAHICNAVQYAVGSNRSAFYQTTAQFVSAREATDKWKHTAAANWHALTSYVARQADHGILLDIGSTTTDIIPFAHGQCASRSITDTDRLLNHELVYTGIVRSPVCSLVTHALIGGRKCQVAQELFATTLDAYLILQKISESEDNRFTADHRPATIACARQRLARHLCADAMELDDATIENFAQTIASAQRELIQRSIDKVVALTKRPKQAFVISGQGQWLAKEIVQSIPGELFIISVGELWNRRDQKLASAATAFALAQLATHFFAPEPTIEARH